MSRTYRNVPSDPDAIRPEPTHLQLAEANRRVPYGWYNLTGMGETQPAANCKAADVLVFMYREVQS